MVEQESPKGKPVSLFVTCMVDMLHPCTGVAAVEVMEYLGVEVGFPSGQTCCGQPAFNVGYHREARQVAKQFFRTFENSELIVTPSGSCAAIIRHEYPKLFADDPGLLAEAERLAGITWEFSEFLVDGLGVADLNSSLNEPTKIAIHDACHGLRVLALKEASHTLIGNLGNVTVIGWDNSEICCGFGGLFSVKMPEVSGAMLQKKLDSIAQCGADYIVTGDISCMTHMNGGLQKQGKAPAVRHIADVLAESIRREQ
jgi:L-lactate dehydrogenase complex protein LldE